MDHRLTHLFDAAREAAQNAHAPYSRFRVGAAIRSESGTIFAGCNVENAAYPVGICAEAGAIAAMIMHGSQLIKDIAIVSLSENPCWPCGACRQRIFEFADQTTNVHVLDEDGLIKSHSIQALLPYAFGPDALSNKTV